MIDNRKDMSCEEFSACMAELIAAGRDIYAHPHVRRCKVHRALLDDLETIAKTARKLFPDVDPSDTLWDGIQARLPQESPAPMLAAPWPGCRVMFAMQVIEGYNADASPPASSPPVSPVRLKVFGATRALARRGGLDDR
jgi:hypothetical protein